MESFLQINLITIKITIYILRNLKEELNKTLGTNLFFIKKPCKRAEEMKMKTHTQDLMRTKNPTIRTSIKITKIRFHQGKYLLSPLQDSTPNLPRSKTITWKEMLRIAFFLVTISLKSLTAPEKEFLMINTVLLELHPQTLPKVVTSTPVQVKVVPEQMAEMVCWPVSFEENLADKFQTIKISWFMFFIFSNVV